jgi:hypothetical protein
LQVGTAGAGELKIQWFMGVPGGRRTEAAGRRRGALKWPKYRHDQWTRFMSMSLRDQLLQAGLVNEKQVREAERQQQQQQQGRQKLPKQQRGLATEQQLAVQQAQQAKAARDQQLNRQQQHKAERKARLAQIRQLIEQSRLPKGDSGEYYNFVDGNKIRRIAIDASLRQRLHRGEIAIVRYDAGYEWVPAATAARIRERDERAVVVHGTAAESSHSDDAYQAFGVPDDLMW